MVTVDDAQHFGAIDVSWGDGVYDLSTGENYSVAMKKRSNAQGTLATSQRTMNCSSA